jgi:hypothetical protein
MDPITGYLILLALGFMLRSAVDHARTDYKRTRDKELATATVKAGKPLTPSVKAKLRRQHRTGWWASEIGHGMPVTRTGLHTGWLAHKATAMHTKAQREAARTTHLDAAASFASAVRDHRNRQEAARADIEAALATSPVVQDGTAKAVREAAEDAVVLQFPKRPPYDPAPMDKAWSENWRIGDRRPPVPVCSVCSGPGSDADPLVPAGTGFFSHRSHVEKGEAILRGFRDLRAEPGPHAKPDLSSWLRPGDPKCEACGGRGTNPDRTDACAVCRGWGRADPDPATMTPAPEGAACAACGNAGTPDNPVLTDPAGQAIHRSHLTDAHERYQSVLNLQANAARTTPSPATEGEPSMSGDTTFGGVRQASTAAIGAADQDTATISARKNAAFHLADEMVALDVDPAVVSEQMAYAEALNDAEAALIRAQDHAAATGTQLERIHGGMEEATVSAPGKIAAREFHGE